MNNKAYTHTHGRMHSEGLIILVVSCLVVSLILKAANCWLGSPIVAKLAAILGAVPVLAILAGLILFVAMKPYIDRRIRREMNKEQEQNQHGAAPRPPDRPAHDEESGR